MPENYTLHLRPKAKPQAVVEEGCYRFTVLTDALIRLEYQSEGHFTDEATQTVICRDFPVPEYRVMEKGKLLEIVTDKLHLYYNKQAFSPQGLTIQLKEGFHVYGSNWSFGDEIKDLKGTARTLDGADGAVELDSGLLSRGGFTVLDDSRTALITEDRWIEPRNSVFVVGSLNPVFGAVMSLVMLYFFRTLRDKRASHRAIKAVAVLGAYLWSTFLGVAFGGTCVILTAVLWAVRERQNLRLIAGCFVGIACAVFSPLYLFSPIAFLVIHFYSGERGRQNRLVKYLGYPVILTACILISQFVG